MKVAVIGVGVTKFGKLENKTSRELFAEAVDYAIKDAGVSPKEIESVYVGNFTADLFEHQGHIGPLMADYAGLRGLPSIRLESACASGAAALRQGILSILSGLYDIVLVGGVEKMTDLPTSDVTDALSIAADNLFEASVGATFPGEYAMIAKAHMDAYGTTREQLAAVAVKNHHNGFLNPKAHFQKEIDLNKALSAPMIAWPLGLYDCSPISDGAAALILAREDVARKYTDTPVFIVASAQATDTVSLFERESLTSLRAARIAAKKAYEMAGVTSKDIDLAEVHDCFTIAEIVATEDLGFFPPGEGGRAVEQGLTQIDGDIAVNPSGGLKAKGHPVGCTGVAQAVEISIQLRGEAGKRQVNGAEVGLTHNIGGSGATAIIHIFRR
ncbi:MAG: thiolase domain-containing protein [Candidatus Odinarchaeum yellowstonii]|uniref:Thiolase domain-containing protein n=1 Tax=Odinarchaeota yellowstonii (strain LCB_4) TaxID=1841599 RepID=A0AAF0D323_ODILC|nr:MAG: thiolase domain-containing protein [Candidatus Odinarchaeum yellowstonii]